MDFSSTLRTTLAMVFESKTVKQRLRMYTVIQKFEKNLKKLLFLLQPLVLNWSTELDIIYGFEETFRHLKQF